MLMKRKGIMFAGKRITVRIVGEYPEKNSASEKNISSPHPLIKKQPYVQDENNTR